MDKQAQDERWQALTEDGRKSRIASYKELLKLNKEEADSYLITIEDLEKLYGKHNLNPEPQIKTWEDVEDNYVEYQKYVAVSNDIEEGIINIEDKLRLKLLATYRIAKLIELGYRGIASEEEYDYKVFWNIVANRKNKKAELNIVSNYDAIGNVLTFRSYELAYGFLSYESNRKLVEQYYMM